MASRIELTVKQLAQLEQVTERTVWHWIQKGAVKVRRTPGGGVRISLPTESELKSSENQGSPST